MKKFHFSATKADPLPSGSLVAYIVSGIAIVMICISFYCLVSARRRVQQLELGTQMQEIAIQTSNPSGYCCTTLF